MSQKLRLGSSTVQVPAQVEYERAASVDHALTLLARYAPGARILAGGHSLIPMMKLRLAQPEVLVDINGIGGLRYIERAAGELRIGALARHADLLASPAGLSARRTRRRTCPPRSRP
jgi:carbon-monoxide dehydrogenase medium subunit